MAYLNAGLRISLTDRRVVNEDGSFKHETFYSEEGLREFVRFIESSREHLINDVIYLNTEKQNIPIEVAIMYNTGFSENYHSYVNNINTIEGGTHLAGFRRALTRTLKKYAEDSKMLEKVKVEISGDDFREGLTAVISVKVAEPQFEGQTKTKLGNNEVMGAVDQAVGEVLNYYLEEHPKEAKAIVDKVIFGCYCTPRQPAKRVRWYSVNLLCQVAVFRVNWPTARTKIRRSVSCSSSRETLPAVQLSKAVTVRFRLFFHYAVRF